MNSKTSLSHKDKEPENGVLYLVEHLLGIFLIFQKGLIYFRKCFLIACEDTRQTRKL